MSEQACKLIDKLYDAHQTLSLLTSHTALHTTPATFATSFLASNRSPTGTPVPTHNSDTEKPRYVMIHEQSISARLRSISARLRPVKGAERGRPTGDKLTASLGKRGWFRGYYPLPGMPQRPKDSCFSPLLIHPPTSSSRSPPPPFLHLPLETPSPPLALFWAARHD